MKTGLISRIQRYSTKDGPGIRSTVFMQQCNLRCQWCANPETIRPGFNVFWFKERCRQCGTCTQAAVNNTITMAKPGNGVNIDRKNCTNLLDMVDMCPYDGYEKVGKEMTSRELADLLLRDKSFYDSSHGGVTFSGGEPALQAEFVRETALLLKEAGVHVCLDTAGHIRWEKLRPLIETVDLVSYDFKAFNPETHLACTGVDNRLILENAQAIESVLIQQGVVAIAKAGLTAEQVTLLRQTGVVVVTDVEQGSDVTFAQDTVEELAEKIVQLVRL